MENVIDEITTEVEEVKTDEIVPEEPKSEAELKTPEQKFEKKKKTAQERIREITADKWKFKLDNEKLKRENEELKSKLNTVPKVPNPQKFTDEIGTFDEEGYAKAMDDYTGKLVESKIPKPVEEEEIDLVQVWEDVAVKAIKKYPDFREVTTKEIFTPLLIQALYERASMDVEEGTIVSADLSHYLGKNEMEAKRIGNLPPRQMLDELEKIEKNFDLLEKKISKATEPIVPLAGKDGTLKKKPSEMTDQEWQDNRRKEKLLKLKKG